MRALITSFVHNESGATAIEYGMLASLVALGVISAFTITGGGLQNLFGAVGSRSGASINAASNSL